MSQGSKCQMAVGLVAVPLPSSTGSPGSQGYILVQTTSGGARGSPGGGAKPITTMAGSGSGGRAVLTTLQHTSSSSEADYQDQDDKDHDEGMVKCELCKRLLRAGNLAKHNENMHGAREQECPVCNEKFTNPRQFQRHKKIAHLAERPFACDREQCGKKYFTKAELNAHVRMMHDPTAPLYRCDQCPYATKAKANLNLHQRRHTGAFSHFCDRCGQGCYSVSELQVHIQSIHQQLRPYQCDRCEKSYKHQNDLKSHIEHVHEPVMQTCEICDEVVESKVALRVHKRVRHNIGGKNKDFLCDLCGKHLKTASSLVEHKRVHTGEKPLQCSYCEKSFAKKTTLRVHERVQHLGERRYRCDVCDTSFTQRSTLVAHNRLHTGERPYLCDSCPSSFVTRSALNAHKINHK